MHTDNERTEQSADVILDSIEDGGDKSLHWLLDIDLDEPEEKLFSLAEDEDASTELTAYEAEVAARPMFRGKDGADDLDTYVGEEIVISSGGQANDIYTNEVEEVAEEEGGSAMMALDFSSDASVGGVARGAIVDGMDILGLTDDDDIGEQNLVLRRAETVADSAAPVAELGAGSGPVENNLDVTPAEPLELAVQSGEQQQELPAHQAGDFLGEDFEMDFSMEQSAVDDLDLGDMPGEAEQVSRDLQKTPPEEVQSLAAGADSEAGDSGAAITPAVSQVVEELLALVRDTLGAQGKPTDSVRVEVMLGSEAASVETWLAQGYEPLLSVCEQPVPALQALRQTDVDAIYVRLVQVENEETVNSLLAVELQSDPEMTLESVLEAAEELTFSGELAEAAESADIIEVQFDTVSPEEAAVNNVFGEDIFADDLSMELPATTGDESTDIDAMFDELESPVVAEEAIFEAVDGAELGALDAAEKALQQAPVAAPEVAPLEQAVELELEPIEAPVQQQEPQSLLPVAETPAAPASVGDGDMSWCVPEGIEFNYTSQSGAEIFADFLDAFIEEGASELEKLEDAVGEWEQDATGDTAMATVTRTLHTLKGIAKGVGLQRYGTLIHNFETLLEALPSPESDATHDYFQIVNAWLDAAVRGLDFVREQRTDIASELPYEKASEPADNSAEVSAEPMVAAVAPVAAAQESEQDREDRRELDKQLADEGAKVLAAQQSVRITSEKLDHLLNLTNQAQQLGVRTAQGTARGKRASSELQARVSSVRMQITEISDRSLSSVTSRGRDGSQELDALEMDQYSELQEVANILREGIEDLADLVEMTTRQNLQVEALLKQQAGVISSIGSSIQAARVVPVSRLMPGLRRIVRTVGADLNKSVGFKVRNEVGSLERDDYGRCQIILEHMVRNALDHGIESPDQRMAAGKETTGQITIDVSKSGADYIVTLTDDGKGIDPAVMRESVRSKGLNIDVDSLSDDEALRLIFHKGFSTARELSQVSGRGVGMDIVLTELQQMGGDIQVSSDVGRGTTFTLRIPANVTVNGALLVTAGESSYAIPLGGLIAVEHIAVQEFFDAVESGSTVSLSGMDCEPSYLATLCSGANLPDPTTLGASLPVIIAGTGPRYMAIAIDDVEEALEMVIRSIGPQFSAVPGVAGAATTDSGQAVVALDLNLLAAGAARTGGASVSVEAEREESLLAMVVDDSRTQRMVTTSQLDTLGVESFTAENGQVAIDLLNSAERLPDIILMDVEMPLKDGIQTLREIRKSHRYGHIPVIMITSRTGLKHRSLAEEAGCNGYMGKPFNFRMLVAQINELTGYTLQLS